MHKNPFGPQATYPPTQQPPLPPGPPPAPGAQPNYAAAYWANAAAQAQVPQPYTGQWTAATSAPAAPQAPAAPAPSAPSAEQSALYANYGYGQQWHAQQQRAAQPPPPPPPQAYAQPAAAPAPYNPYQPYPTQSYALPAPPPAPPMQQQPFPAQQQQQQQQQRPFYPPQPQQQQQQQRPQHNVHHTPPAHMPPAKRQRFDSGARPPGPLPQPQFQAPLPPPPAPMLQQPLPMNGGSFNAGRGAAPGGMSMRGAPRGRGGGSMGSMRGNAQRGRGGGSFVQRGGGPPTGGFAKPHNPRGSFGGPKDFGNRRGGGSFNGGPGFGGGHQGFQQNHHQGGLSGGASFRGRAGYHNTAPRGRQDGGSFGHRERDSASLGSASFNAGGASKKEENRRTLTDFKIVGLEIREVAWAWGVLPAAATTSEAPKVEETPNAPPSDAPSAAPAADPAAADKPAEQAGGDEPEAAPTQTQTEPAAPSTQDAAAPAPAQPPCRMRLYFHSPVTPEDARPIPAGAGASAAPAPEDGTARKGKRKKLEDDDGEGDERRARPRMLERDASAAPSAAETASEGDWLMAAIGEDADADAEGEGDAEDELHVSEVHEGEPQYHAEGLNDYGGTQEDTQASSVLAAEMPGLGSAEAAPPADQVAAASPATEPPQSVVSPSSPVRVQANANGTTPVLELVVSASEPASEPALALALAGGAHPANAPHSAEQVPALADDEQSQLAATLAAGDASVVTDDSGGTQVDTQPELSVSVSYDGSTAASLSGSLSAPPTVATYGELNELPLPAKEEAPAPRTPSANRVSISYAAGTRRLVIDAAVVSRLRLFRAEGRVEIVMQLERAADTAELAGVLVESLSDATKLFSPIEIFAPLPEPDDTVPPFATTEMPREVTLRVYLDTERPLSEPRWAKTGDIHEWLKSLLGGRFWVTGDAASRWESKIEVVDPDPAPTIWTILDQWTGISTIGSQTERQRFVKTHLSEPENMLEILLRLVRGERATAFSATTPAISPSSVSGPLLAALTGAPAHGAQQTHVSLAVLAMFKLAIEFGERAAAEKGRAEAEERVGEIVRCIPTHLLYKSVEGIFKEWKAETKRNGR